MNDELAVLPAASGESAELERTEGIEGRILGQRMSGELSRVVREVQLGIPMIEALGKMVHRNDSEDMRLMLTAVQIQQQVGGNLAQILDSIEYTIRERIRIKGEIRTLTAQQRLSGYVVGFLPIALALFLFVAAPS